MIVSRGRPCPRPAFWLLTRQFTGDVAGLTRTARDPADRDPAGINYLTPSIGNLSRPGRTAAKVTLE